MPYTLELHTASGWQPLPLHRPTPIRVERGIRPGQHVAQPGHMRLALHDPDGLYTPGHPAQLAAFTLGAPLRLLMDGSPLFTGRVSRVMPGDSVTNLEAVDYMAVLAATRLSAFPLLLTAGSGAAVSALLAQAPPPLNPAVVAAGRSTFPFVGDTWPEGLPLRAALVDVVRSEGGYLWVSADGTPHFTGRDGRQGVTTAAGSVAAGFAALTADTSRGRLATRVTVTVVPRTVGTGPEVLWQKDSATLLDPGETRTLLARYRDPDQRVADIAALSIITPAGYTADDNAGGDLTAQVTLSMTAGGRSARLTLTNTAPVKAYVRDLQVRGTALRTYLPVSVTVDDAAAQAAYGLHPLALELPLQESTRTAEAMARALLVQRKAPHPWVTVTLEATAAPTLAHTLEPGDRLDITDAARGLNPAVTFIDGVRHFIEGGGQRHRVTWATSPAETTSFWLLGTPGNAEIGLNTHIGY